MIYLKLDILGISEGTWEQEEMDVYDGESTLYPMLQAGLALLPFRHLFA